MIPLVNSRNSLWSFSLFACGETTDVRLCANEFCNLVIPTQNCDLAAAVTAAALVNGSAVGFTPRSQWVAIGIVIGIAAVSTVVIAVVIYATSRK